MYSVCIDRRSTILFAIVNMFLSVVLRAGIGLSSFAFARALCFTKPNVDERRKKRDRVICNIIAYFLPGSDHKYEFHVRKAP